MTIDEQYKNQISNLEKDISNLTELKNNIEHKLLSPTVEKLRKEKCGKWLLFDETELQFRKIVNVYEKPDFCGKTCWYIDFKIIDFDKDDDTYLNVETSYERIYNVNLAELWLALKTIPDAEMVEKVNIVFENIKNKYLKNEDENMGTDM